MADKNDDKDKKTKKPKDVDPVESKADEDDGDEDGEACKSLTLADELKKSRQEILDHLNSKDPALRKSALLAKAQNGKLSDEDNRELIAHLSGKTLDDALSDRVAKSMQPESLKKSLDASPYLADMHKSSIESHMTLAKAMQNSLETFNETAFAMAANLALLTKSQAALLDEVDELRKSHAEVLAQPVGAPRTVGVTPVVRKSANAGEAKLDNDTVKRTLQTLFSKSRDANEQRRYGDAMSAFAVHKGPGAIDASVMQEIEKYVGANA